MASTRKVGIPRYKGQNNRGKSPGSVKRIKSRYRAGIRSAPAVYTPTFSELEFDFEYPYANSGWEVTLVGASPTDYLPEFSDTYPSEDTVNETVGEYPLGGYWLPTDHGYWRAYSDPEDLTKVYVNFWREPTDEPEEGVEVAVELTVTTNEGHDITFVVNLVGQEV